MTLHPALVMARTARELHARYGSLLKPQRPAPDHASAIAQAIEEAKQRRCAPPAEVPSAQTRLDLGIDE